MNYKHSLPRAARDGEPVSWDIEMFQQDRDRLHRPHGIFACITIAYSKDEVYLVSDQHDLRDVFERIDNGYWIGHNLEYDIRQLRRFLPIRQRPIHDTMVFEQSLFGGWYDQFSLSDVARRWLGAYISKDEREKFGNRTTLTRSMMEYAARDAAVTLQVYQAQRSYVKSNQVSTRPYDEADEPTIWSILDMPPVRVDVDGWLELARANEEEGRRIEEEVGLNVYSWQQVKAEVSDRVGYEIENTQAETLLNEAERNPSHKEFIERVLEARMYRKAASTYGEKWVEKHVEEGNLVYPDWKNNGTETGRFACRHPNLQNIPARKMPVFRSLFVPRLDDGRFAVADVSQQEPKILAWFSGDQNLRDAASTGDVYQPVGERIERDRDTAKAIFLGMSYGMSPIGLAKQLQIPEQEAHHIVDEFFRQYPGVNNYINKQRNMAASVGYVRTADERRVWINPYNDQWERNAQNSPIQGTAAGQMKVALSYIHQSDVEFRVPLVVHDEIVADCESEAQAEEYALLMREAWLEAGERVVPGIPMDVEIEVGDNWGVLK